MKKIIIISVLIMGFSNVSFSQDKSTDLKRLFTLMNTDKMVDAIMNNIIPILKKQANDQIQGPEAKEKFDMYIEFMMNETRELSKKLINEEMVQIYDNHFTHQEIKDLIAFYESSTGQKMLEVTPEISKDLMNAMSEKYMPESQAKLNKKLDELK
jgi:uncharacterized protein